MADYDPERVRKLGRPRGLPFNIGKIGHVVLNVRDIECSARFYTEILGFRISDAYPEEMVPVCSCAATRIIMASRWSAQWRPKRRTSSSIT